MIRSLRALVLALSLACVTTAPATASAHAAALTVEPSSESDVEVIVIRQKTTKTSGYHTDGLAVRRIAQTAWANVTRILLSEGKEVKA